ncbi:glycoside hydrolase family 2 protein [Actinopolymorpha pittospori]|uniref:Beta-galactosidase n=1 Tax=Actinopolymorpha pittospori TaxID=648752 RepID=A0A927R6I2_9ACTN|nr:glycoside hydrolase family 2 TIM barrel-domain containing protein [Actinopolymorpha pittospori]MBE1603154.1 beta-galactosidase [Actinopolymorpha pittospori]
MSTATRSISLDTDWRFGGEVPLPGIEDALDPDVLARLRSEATKDADWTAVTVPHTVTPLSWKLWNPESWEKVWVYRRHFAVPEDFRGQRIFVDFGAAMTTAVVSLNGTELGQHRGGYLPFSFEITDLVQANSENSDNVLTVVVDSRFNLNVPPNIPAPALSSSLDYLQPGGIHRSVRLRAVPATFISQITTTHHDALDPDRRRSTFGVAIDGLTSGASGTVRVDLRDGEQVLASADVSLDSAAGTGAVDVELGGLRDVQLWDVDDPRLYDVVVSLTLDGQPVHEERLRTGYREARFEPDGFYLNGTRRYLLGVNRHGYFPFTGFAMPDRVHRQDAQIIKRDLNCVMVRCSHYPQTESFLDACDELGLLVWEEPPGWQYVGDSAWQDLIAQDIEAMIARDRHRPSIIVWGARLNETPDRPDFYARTEALVKKLDPTRTTSGTMHGEYARTQVFQHDLFGYDDYHTTVDERGERRPLLLEPIDGRPYLLSEAISTRSSPTTLYRRADPADVQQHQALDYAYSHDEAMGDHRFAGLLAWVGFDYEANMGNHHRGVKTSGLGDVFRVLKPGAAIYRSQVDPARRVVIEPAFTWNPPEFGQANAFGGRAEGRLWSPGAEAMICSNCDRLEVYLGERHVASIAPDRERFPHLPYAPSFVDLTLAETDDPELRIDGYLDGKLVGTRRFSGDRSGDSLALTPDETEILADGVDAVRVVLAVVDRYGEARGSSRAVVDLEVSGPGELIGDNPFDLDDTGAVAAVWVRSVAGEPGRIIVRASTPEWGSTTAILTSRAN